MTTYSIDYMYFIEEDDTEERDGGAGTARGSTMLGRPIIVGVDRKTGGVHAHQVKCKGSRDPWIATRIAADIEELGCAGSRVVRKANQEEAIADVQRQKIRTLKDALERRLNRRIMSSDAIFPWMVEWSAGSITYVNGQAGRTASLVDMMRKPQ